MKRYIIYILLIFTFGSSLFAQNDKDIAIKSLEFLNRKLYLHLNELNEPILISFNNHEYVCNEYLNKDSLSSISMLRVHYELNKIEENKFQFTIEIGGLYGGTFEVNLVDGIYEFPNLTYIIRSN